MHVWSSGLSCASPGGLVWWGRRGFTRQPESQNVHIFRVPAFKTPTKFNERTPRERRMKIVAGGGKKERNFGRSGGGLSGGGLSSGGLSSGRVHRQWGAEFGVSGSVQVFRDENRNKTKTKMKRDMSKNKKKVKKSKMRKQKKKQEREKEETEQTPSFRLRPINFEFGQFRVRPISTSANFDFGQFRLRPAVRCRIVRSRIGRSRALSHVHGERNGSK